MKYLKLTKADTVVACGTPEQINQWYGYMFGLKLACKHQPGSSVMDCETCGTMIMVGPETLAMVGKPGVHLMCLNCAELHHRVYREKPSDN